MCGSGQAVLQPVWGPFGGTTHSACHTQHIAHSTCTHTAHTIHTGHVRLTHTTQAQQPRNTTHTPITCPRAAAHVHGTHGTNAAATTTPPASGLPSQDPPLPPSLLPPSPLPPSCTAATSIFATAAAPAAPAPSVAHLLPPRGQVLRRSAMGGSCGHGGGQYRWQAGLQLCRGAQSEKTGAGFGTCTCKIGGGAKVSPSGAALRQQHLGGHEAAAQLSPSIPS